MKVALAAFFESESFSGPSLPVSPGRFDEDNSQDIFRKLNDSIRLGYVPLVYLKNSFVLGIDLPLSWLEMMGIIGREIIPITVSILVEDVFHSAPAWWKAFEL